MHHYNYNDVENIGKRWNDLEDWRVNNMYVSIDGEDKIVVVNTKKIQKVAAIV